MASRAIVLSGGGTVGISWETGIIAGLAVAGVPVAEFDFILGSSAGSIVGAQIAAGRDPQALYESQLVFPSTPLRMLPLGPARYAFNIATTGSRGALRRVPVARAVGAFARIAASRHGAVPHAEERWIARIAEILDVDTWPDRFHSTAIDAASGQFRVFDQASGVDLAHAIAASCAVPGIFPPVSIGGRRYMDGGLRTKTNADVAAGHDLIVIVAVMTQVGLAGRLALRELEREASLLRSQGSRVVTIIPDANGIATMGTALMRNGRRAQSAEAGYRQGVEEVVRLLDAWG